MANSSGSSAAFVWHPRSCAVPEPRSRGGNYEGETGFWAVNNLHRYALYAITEPLVRPFQGIWPQTSTPVVFDLPALLAIVFLFLIAALVVALVRAIAGNRTV